MTLTGGHAPLGSARGEHGPTLILAVSEGGAWPPSTSLVTVPWPRNERSAVAGLKTTSYAENVVALAYAHEHGASEAVYLNTVGQVCEGTGSNLFAVIDDRLVTPPLSSGCLAGVTRALVLEWTDAAEADIMPADLARASEAFICSSTRDVQPVNAIDGRDLPAPGKVTTAVAITFAERAALDVDP